MSGDASPTMLAALWAESPALCSSSLAVPKFSDAAAVTAAATWSFADWMAASKSVLLTQDAEAEAVGGTVAGGVEVVEVVDEQATTITNEIAADATQRCMRRFSTLEPL
jgi:hypothetical protein